MEIAERRKSFFSHSLIRIPTYLHAPVAQGTERQPPELKAAGSNPAGRTKLNKTPLLILRWGFIY